MIIVDHNHDASLVFSDISIDINLKKYGVNKARQVQRKTQRNYYFLNSYIYLKLVPEDKIPKKKDFIESLKGGGISNNIIIFLILFFIIYFWRKKLTYI